MEYRRRNGRRDKMEDPNAFVDINLLESLSKNIKIMDRLGI